MSLCVMLRPSVPLLRADGRAELHHEFGELPVLAAPQQQRHWGSHQLLRAQCVLFCCYMFCRGLIFNHYNILIFFVRINRAPGKRVRNEASRDRPEQRACMASCSLRATLHTMLVCGAHGCVRGTAAIVSAVR